MQKSKKLTILALLLGIFLLTLACEGVDENISLPLFEIDNGFNKPLTGQVTGSAASVWRNIYDQTVTCPDSAAEYQMTIASDSKLPEDTHITGSIDKNLHYFRLEVYAVLRLLTDDHENNTCLMRDPSDDRTHVIIEGSVDGKTLQFKVLSCGEYDPAGSEVYFTSDFVVSGDITCKSSDAYKRTFKFSGLNLK